MLRLREAGARLHFEGIEARLLTGFAAETPRAGAVKMVEDTCEAAMRADRALVSEVADCIEEGPEEAVPGLRKRMDPAVAPGTHK